ncbi:MAG: hypothetical protein CVV27_07760 [Candidatus Melainabacteria bacterium HGW-Melainabacteria-1]|nr:MAG: hypothetical protein CVV27_07760 [Candidatus Melainabacteria bacterium HGW-Melainabacteria-1]
MSNMQITNPTAAWIQKTLAPVEKAGNTINTAMATGMTQAMGGSDTYQANSLPATPNKVHLYQLFDDPMRPPNPLDYKIANRLGWVGINDSAEFLKAADTPFKRKMISYLAGGLFLNRQDRQYVDYQITAWAGQSDLMRAGADLGTARLLQVSGAGDVALLSRYRNPVDKGVFYAAMSANAIQYGYWMPSFSVVSQMIDRAANTPPVIRWY